MVTKEDGRKNLFVVGLDPFNRRLLERLPDADRYRILPLLDPETVVRADEFDLPAILDEARRILREAPEAPDGIAGYWDFPTTLMLPILRRELGLPGPTLESLLRCEHKYWSRLCQRRAIPEMVPRFQLVDPFADDVQGSLKLGYPFWIKPIKSHSSYLGFGVHRPGDLEYALSELRAGIGRFAEPFDHILQHAELPEEIAAVPGRYCLAEELVATNWQCTLEGWVQGGDVEVYGIVDSIREGVEHSSFARYQYPSHLPARAKDRMVGAVERLVPELGLDDSPFNVEFFYDEVEDRIWLLEMNARASKSHSPLFERVDGASNFLVMVAIALGERPRMPHGEGTDPTAAKFMVRVYHDGVVARAPSEADLAALRRELPSVEAQILVSEGVRLSDLPNQDSYTYEVADLFIGGRDEGQLLERYHRSLELLPFEFRHDEPARADEPKTNRRTEAGS